MDAIDDNNLGNFHWMSSIFCFGNVDTSEMSSRAKKASSCLVHESLSKGLCIVMYSWV